jgi:serine/threonine protein phosphatase PrpC
VLCTDGLWNYWERGTVRAALPRDPDDDPLTAARALVGAALRSGGEDNVTVAVLPVVLAALSPSGAPAAATVPVVTRSSP